MASRSQLLMSPLYLAVVGAVIAVVMLAMRRSIRLALQPQRLNREGRLVRLDSALPNAFYVLVCTSSLALLIIFLSRYARRLGWDARWLFAKEGPLEDFTFLGFLAAASLLGAAAGRSWRRLQDSSRMAVALAYSTAALLCFFVGMEEISWGQQLLSFSTPQSWAQINFQQETTLHNLWDNHALTSSAAWIACVFAVGAIALTVLHRLVRHSFTHAIAPHPSLAPLALAIAYAGLALHPEIVEVFIALYFVAYGYRAYRLSAQRAPLAARGFSPTEQSRMLVRSDILEYTHDAIIIWEMHGKGVLYWNNAAEQLYGYTRNEAARQTTPLLLKTQVDGGVDELEARLARYRVWAGDLVHTTKADCRIAVQSRLALMSQQNGCWLVLEVNRAPSHEHRSGSQRAVEEHLQALRSRVMDFRS